MAHHILVTGSTGTVGRVVVERLLDAGTQVWVLSRGRRRTGPGEHVVGDVKTGDGLAEAVDGVETIVHCVHPAHRLVEAALRGGKPSGLHFDCRSGSGCAGLLLAQAG